VQDVGRVLREDQLTATWCKLEIKRARRLNVGGHEVGREIERTGRRSWKSGVGDIEGRYLEGFRRWKLTSRVERRERKANDNYGRWKTTTEDERQERETSGTRLTTRTKDEMTMTRGDVRKTRTKH